MNTSNTQINTHINTHTNHTTNTSLYIAQRLTKRELFIAAHKQAKAQAGNYRASFAKALKALYTCVLVINTTTNKARVMVKDKAQALVAKYTKKTPLYNQKQFNVGDKRVLVGNIYLQKKTFGWTIEGKLATGREIYTSVTNYQVEGCGGIKNAMQARLDRCIANKHDFVAFEYKAAVQALIKAGK